MDKEYDKATIRLVNYLKRRLGKKMTLEHRLKLNSCWAHFTKKEQVFLRILRQRESYTKNQPRKGTQGRRPLWASIMSMAMEE